VRQPNPVPSESPGVRRAPAPVDAGAPISVVLATDSFLLGDGLASLLVDVPGVEVVGRARDLPELRHLVEDRRPDVVLVSLRGPAAAGTRTVAVARQLRDGYPELGIVVISGSGDAFALELLRFGAARLAFLLDERLPGLDAVLDAMRDVCAGRSVIDPSVLDALVARREPSVIDGLTARETEVLAQMARGLCNRGIAEVLFLSVKGVEKHVTTIFRKLGLTDARSLDRRVAASLLYLGGTVAGDPSADADRLRQVQLN
jgi:DNA-binding NarL/FixJ family response regulator